MMIVPMMAAAIVQQQSPDTLIDAAAQATAAKRFDRAIALLEQARAQRPEDATVLRLLGTNQAYAGRYPQAIATLREAVRLSPDDLDIRAALARAYLWSGDGAAARRQVEEMRQRDPANADAQAIAAQIGAAGKSEPAVREVPTKRSWGLGIAQSIADVSLDGRGHQTWWNSYISAFGDIGPATTLSAEVERAKRTRTDTHLTGRVDHRFSDAVRGYVSAAVTPNADFREQWGFRAGGEVDIGRGWTLTADGRYSEFHDIQVGSFEPGIRKYVVALHGSLGARMINLWDESGDHRVGWSGRYDGELADGTLLFAGAATYPDTEAGVTRQTWSGFAGAALPVGDGWRLRLTGEYERREQSYRRAALTLGVQARF